MGLRVYLGHMGGINSIGRIYSSMEEEKQRFALRIRQGNLKELMLSASSKVSKLSIMKEKVKQSLEGCMGSLRRINEQFGGAARASDDADDDVASDGDEDDDVYNYSDNEELMMCGLSKEEVEWRWDQHKRVHQHMQQAVMELRHQSLRMRRHFETDPDPSVLLEWISFEEQYHHFFANTLVYRLSCPPSTANSVLYEHLMKKKVHHESFAGMLARRLDKLKQGRINKAVGVGELVAVVAAGFAVGIAVGSYLRKQEQTQET